MNLIVDGSILLGPTDKVMTPMMESPVGNGNNELGLENRNK